MSNPRIFALIGLASAAAAIAPLGPEPTLTRPVVYAITVTPETVWFCSKYSQRYVPIDFAFIRSSREWMRSSRPAPCAGRKSLSEYEDTIPLGRRMAAFRVAIDSSSRDDAPAGRRFLRIHDSASNRRIDLRPVLTRARVARLIEAGSNIGADTVSTTVGGVAISDSIAWIGLGGGFAEGQGDVGGLYRIERRTGTWEFITDSTLAEHFITGLAATGDWVWAGTVNPAELGAYGDAGLLRYNVRTHAWKSYQGSPLPDALVHTLESDGRILALATEKGLAVIELGAGTAPSGDETIATWNTRWFVPAFVGDSLVTVLGDKTAATLTPIDEARFILTQRFAELGRERALFESLKRLPADSVVHAAFASDEAAQRTLAALKRPPGRAKVGRGGRGPLY